MYAIIFLIKIHLIINALRSYLIALANAGTCCPQIQGVIYNFEDNLTN